MPADLGQQIAGFLPEIFLALWGISLILMDLFVPREKKNYLGYLAIAGLLVTVIPIATISGDQRYIFEGEYVIDSFGVFFRYFTVIATAIVLLMSIDFMEGHTNEGEFYALMVFAALGVMMMGASTDLIMIFLAIEFVSITSYILTGYLVHDLRSGEAALKYLLFGSVSAAMMLYGMSLIYGITGSLGLVDVAGALSEGPELALYLGMAFLLSGFGFKIAMVPFHMWSPDAYEGAPTPVTAFLSAVPKAAGMAVLLRTLATAFPVGQEQWMMVLAVASAATMTIGNLLAIPQTNIKRMLAYSSIAHAGYFLIAVVAFNTQWGTPGLLIYLLAYMFTNLGAFAIVVITAHRLGTESLDSYNGLAKRAPFLSAAMVVFLLSLVGIPPLGGFVGKLLVFAAAVEKELIWLALIAVVNTVISLYYYVGVIRRMYLVDPAEDTPVKSSAAISTALAVTMAGTVVVGVYPEPFIRWAQSASHFLVK